MKNEDNSASSVSKEILRIALAGQLFNEADSSDRDIMIDNVLEVIHATPNPNVATAILLGIYEVPDIPNTSKYELNATLDWYDKWDDKVNFSYDYQEKVSGYIPREIAKANTENGISLTDFEKHKLIAGASTDDATWVSIPNGNVKRKISNCSLKSWLKPDKG